MLSAEASAVGASALINVIVALRCEAAPLVARYRLQLAREPAPFRCYGGRGLQVVVSGIGKAAAAAAVEYVAAGTATDRPVAWLNVGIAGHSSQAIGEALIASSIEDHQTGARWMVALPDPMPCAASPLCTVEVPEERLRGDCAYDMEASGFYVSALQRARPELVQCLKVVSDNATHPLSSADRISPARATGLISAQLEPINALIRKMTAIAREIAAG